MTPRLPAKRRNDGEGSQDRQNKKGSGAQEPTYDTYDEAMEGGVHYEERAERYRDGDKAQRFYEKAGELYQKAMQLKEDDFDATYNLARIQYKLATDFLLPPSSLDFYGSVMALYRNAMSCTTDPANKNDAAFNMAQAFSGFADLTEEYQGESGAESARELRDGACHLLNNVIVTQQMSLQFQQEQAEKKAAEGGAATGSEAAPASGEVEMGSEAPAAAATTTAAEGDCDATMDEDKPEGEAPESAQAARMPTGDDFCDAILLLTDIGTTVWSAVDPPQPPSDQQQEAVRGLLEVARMYAPESRQAELDLADIKILLALDGIIWDMVRDQATAGSGVERGIEAAIKGLERLLASLETAPPADPTVRADILTELADTEVSAAARYVTLASRSEVPQPLAQSAWAHLSGAVAHYGQAADLPLHTTTPREFRPSVYLKLMNATLARARLAPHNETAARNIQQLFDNCAAYAAKASAAVGWNFPKLPTAADPAPNPHEVTELEPPYPAGWDMEMLARLIPLHMLRVCFFGRTLIPDSKAFFELAARSIVQSICSVSNGPRRLMPQDLGRLGGDVESEEGKISEDEDMWWRQVGQGIRQGLEQAPQAARPLDGASLFD